MNDACRVDILEPTQNTIDDDAHHALLELVGINDPLQVHWLLNESKASGGRGGRRAQSRTWLHATISENDFEKSRGTWQGKEKEQ